MIGTVQPSHAQARLKNEEIIVTTEEVKDNSIR